MPRSSPGADVTRKARRWSTLGAEMGLDWASIEAELWELLGDQGELRFDRGLLEHFAVEIAAGRLDVTSNRITGELEIVGPREIVRTAELSESERRRLSELGGAALARGEVAAAVLNGGMATRFGGAVKGIVEAFGGRSFLEIKLEQALAQGPVPFLVMNSFATHALTLEFLRERGLVDRVSTFLQSVSLRLTPRGEVFRDASGALSPYAPGHGDFSGAIRHSDRLSGLESSGVRTVLLSNVDNLGAELDPLVIGFHLASGRALTVELAESQADDVGGTVLRVDGCKQIVEGFRLPSDFPLERIRTINTNTFVISLEVLRKEYPLSWFYVKKSVDGVDAVQMERLVGELSAFVPANYLASPRGGAEGRFFPVKTPEDLERMREDEILRRRFGRR